MKLDTQQLLAVDRAINGKRLLIISGGAGVGKTHTTKFICDEFDKIGQPYALCAFAGKAAARLREATRRPASTLHRLLRFNGKQYLLELDALKDIVVLCDESSMLDSQILAELIRRNPKKLILVGDQAQLPPVGRAQPYHDILTLRPDLVVELKTSYRATEAVFQAATVIRAGGRPPMEATSDGEKWTMTNTGSAARTQAQILEWVEAGTFDFQQDIILVARNGESDTDPCTVRGLNAAIVDTISPREGKRKFNTGDRVINTKNLPELDVWNGTTGTVHAIDQDGGIWVRTDIPVIDWRRTHDERAPVYTDHVLFGKDVRSHLQLAYALTVHKSQGSQYRRVLMACFQRDTFGLLDRSLLYTGVTRTKQACCVVGELSAVWTAIDKVNRKRTIIQELAAVDAA